MSSTSKMVCRWEQEGKCKERYKNVCSHRKPHAFKTSCLMPCNQGRGRCFEAIGKKTREPDDNTNIYF